MDGWTDEQTNEWMDGQTDEWKDGWMNGRTDGRMEGWMDGFKKVERLTYGESLNFKIEDFF